jgi:hypothetical protein
VGDVGDVGDVDDVGDVGDVGEWAARRLSDTSLAVRLRAGSAL